jgi:hypothetical protein
MELMQWTRGRGYSTLVVAMRKTRVLLRLKVAKVNLEWSLKTHNGALVTLPPEGMWGIFAAV